MHAHGEKKHKEQVRIDALSGPRWTGLPRWLIGIDDTDNLESRGTGFRARMLGEALAERGLARVSAITRHQLLVAPEIPYTSHNSSACLSAEAADRAAVIAVCRAFLVAESAAGSDAGLCVAAWDAVDAQAQAFGQRAKVEIVTQAEALARAAGAGVFLEGLTGTHGGVIGALAAVGLRVGGDDGRFLWLPGLRELGGTCTVGELFERGHIDEVQDEAGVALPSSTRVDVGAWVRPVLRAGKAVLLVEEVADHGERTWRILARDRIKQLSD